MRYILHKLYFYKIMILLNYSFNQESKGNLKIFVGAIKKYQIFKRYITRFRDVSNTY